MFFLSAILSLNIGKKGFLGSIMFDIDKRDKRPQRYEIFRTLRRAKVPLFASKEKKNECIFRYVANTNLGFYDLTFTEEQLSDPDFLLGLYRANCQMTVFEKPNPKYPNLQENVDFLMEYLKIKAVYINKNFGGDVRNEAFHLEPSLRDLEQALYNPEFVARAAREFPYVNFVSMIKENFKHSDEYNKKGWKHHYYEVMAKYNDFVSKLPFDVLLRQVEIFGLDALKEIPNNTPDFARIVGVAIEKGGFSALECLDITQVLDNKDLIVKACYYSRHPSDLPYYIKYSLSPDRRSCRFISGIPYYENVFDERYLHVQQELNADPVIQTLLEVESKKSKIGRMRFCTGAIQSDLATDKKVMSR